jgi:hypothetical protein
VLTFGMALGLAGCATSHGVPQMQEVGPGTYSIQIARGTRSLVHFRLGPRARDRE